jgi:hypothetical protein
LPPATHPAPKDLRLYKHYIELTGEETGAWRGEITPDEDEEEGEVNGAEEEPEEAGTEGER